MLVQFKVSTGSSAGWGGFLGALKTIATAGAGTTPVAPADVTNWNVLDNTTAGGWTIITDTVASVISGASGTLFMTAPMKKTGVGEATYLYRKGIKFSPESTYYTSTYTTYSATGLPKIVKYRTTDGATWEQDMAPGGGMAPTSNRYDAWMFGQPAYHEFTVACTSEYLIIFHCDNTFNTRHRILAVMDHSIGNPLDHSTVSLHSPFYGFCIANYSNTTYYTSDNAAYLDEFITLVHHADASSGGFNGLITGGAYLSGLHTSRPGLTLAQNFAMPIYPPFISSSTSDGAYTLNSMFKSDYNADGFEKFSINDIAIQNITRGYYPRVLSGLKQIGITRLNAYIDATKYHSVYGSPKYISSNEATPKTYLMVCIGKNIFGIQKA